MPNQPQLPTLKQQIKDAIRRNSDRGFVPYAGCNRVCAEMASVMDIAEDCRKAGDLRLAFDIYIMLLLETAKLVSHADDSDGGCSEIIYGSLDGINTVCKNVAENEDQYFFDTIIKTAKNKAFEGWGEWAYRLLKSAVYFVNDEKRAGKIYDVFPALGKMYDGEDYPDKYLITLGIVERLQGKEAARRYLFDHLELDEFRKIAVENAITDQDFTLAEKLCKEGLKKNDSGYYSKASQWAYLLEQVYETTNSTADLTAIRRAILLKGDITYFRKLKSLYEHQGVWEQEQLSLWRELPKKIGIPYYIVLLSQENELELLLGQVKRNKSYISQYGKQLAAKYPDETYQIFEVYILDQANLANDRGKYRQVCSHLKSFAEAGAVNRAQTLITRLGELYPRRPAMLEELAKLEKKYAL